MLVNMVIDTEKNNLNKILDFIKKQKAKVLEKTQVSLEDFNDYLLFKEAKQNSNNIKDINELLKEYNIES